MVFFPLPGIFFRATCEVSGITKRLSKLEHELVDVTPAPVFSWLEGLNDRVVGRVEMPGGMLILRRIAAADMPAFQTEAQVYPCISHFQTILTAIRTWRDLTYLVEVATVLCHMFLFSFLDALVTVFPTLL